MSMKKNFNRNNHLKNYKDIVMNWNFKFNKSKRTRNRLNEITICNLL